VFEPAGRRFTATVLHNCTEVGQLDPGLITPPVVEDIGEALVMKHAIGAGEEPTSQRLAEIVDQAILPAVHGSPTRR
jgi:hypothetical protein